MVFSPLSILAYGDASVDRSSRCGKPEHAPVRSTLASFALTTVPSIKMASAMAIPQAPLWWAPDRGPACAIRGELPIIQPSADFPIPRGCQPLTTKDPRGRHLILESRGVLSQQKRLGAQVAKGVQGVKSVTDTIIVEPRADRSDHKIAADTATSGRGCLGGCAFDRCHNQWRRSELERDGGQLNRAAPQCQLSSQYERNDEAPCPRGRV
jgi:hypothetical protein